VYREFWTHLIDLLAKQVTVFCDTIAQDLSLPDYNKAADSICRYKPNMDQSMTLFVDCSHALQ